MQYAKQEKNNIYFTTTGEKNPAGEKVTEQEHASTTCNTTCSNTTHRCTPLPQKKE